MKLPAPGTLREAYSPISVINVLFGIDVLHYPKDKPQPLLSVIWALLILSMDVVLVKMSNLSELKLFMGSTIAASNYKMNIYVHIVFVAVSMFSSQSRSQVTRSIFRKLITINARLKALGIPNDYGLVYKAQVIELFIGFSLMIVIQTLDYIYVGHDYPGNVARISFLAATHHCIVFTFVLDITYNTSIRKLHGDLCTTAMELDQVFGLEVLLSIALSFGILTSLLYTGYTLAADLPLTSILDDIMVKIAAGFWIGFYVVKITRIAVGCAATISEAKQTGDSIQDILEKAAIYNRDIRDELIQNRLCFTAKGFFSLDYTLLSKVIGSVVTFLVIMIQMKNMYDSHNDRVNSTLPTFPSPNSMA